MLGSPQAEEQRCGRPCSQDCCLVPPWTPETKRRGFKRGEGFIKGPPCQVRYFSAARTEATPDVTDVLFNRCYLQRYGYRARPQT